MHVVSALVRATVRVHLVAAAVVIVLIAPPAELQLTDAQNRGPQGIGE
jgi:hypothetical protein